MPLPLAPIAGFALRYGVVAVAAYAVTRRLERAHFDQRAEDAMDDINEGLSVRRDRDQCCRDRRERHAARSGFAASFVWAHAAPGSRST